MLATQPHLMHDGAIIESAPPMSASAHQHHSRRTPVWRVCLLLGAGLAVLGGCTDFPQLDARLTAADASLEFPVLKPAEEVLQTAANNAIQPDTPAALQDRLDALNSRAAALRDEGLDPDTRTRLETGLAAATTPDTAADTPKVQP